MYICDAFVKGDEDIKNLVKNPPRASQSSFFLLAHVSSLDGVYAEISTLSDREEQLQIAASFNNGVCNSWQGVYFVYDHTGQELTNY